MKFTEIDAPDYATAKIKAEKNLRLRSAVRIAMTVVILIFLGLAYSFPYLARDSAEYYVSVLTLILNGFLFLLVMSTAVVLRKRYAKYVHAMEKSARQEAAAPWELRSPAKGE